MSFQVYWSSIFDSTIKKVNYIFNTRHINELFYIQMKNKLKTNFHSNELFEVLLTFISKATSKNEIKN